VGEVVGKRGVDIRQIEIVIGGNLISAVAELLVADGDVFNGDAAAGITVDGVCDYGAGGDGVTLSDFSCYLSTWSAGCP